jgi:acyl-CoA thioester hydrolase
LKEDILHFRVRYGETDQMGVVYYGNYAQYFEMGRTEWLRKLGVSYRWMEKNGIMLPVTELQIKYLKSATYDEVLRIETKLVKLPRIRITFDYNIYNEKNELLTTGTTTLVFIDKTTGKPILAPEYILEKLREEF